MNIFCTQGNKSFWEREFNFEFFPSNYREIVFHRNYSTLFDLLQTFCFSKLTDINFVAKFVIQIHRSTQMCVSRLSRCGFNSRKSKIASFVNLFVSLIPNTHFRLYFKGYWICLISHKKRYFETHESIAAIFHSKNSVADTMKPLERVLNTIE